MYTSLFVIHIPKNNYIYVLSWSITSKSLVSYAEYSTCPETTQVGSNMSSTRAAFCKATWI